MDWSGNACERGAPTLYGSSSNGQWVLPLPPSLHPQKKGYIPSGEGVGGYKTAAMSFDGDGIHSLANTENNIPEIPKPPVCVGAAREHSCDARFEPNTTNHEGRIWGHVWSELPKLHEGYNFTYFNQCTYLQVHFSFGLSSCETVKLIYMWRGKCS